MKIEMPQLTKKEKILALVLAVLLVAALYVFAVYIPVTEQTNSINIQIESLKTENEILEAKSIKYEQMKSELEQMATSSDTKIIPEYDNLNNEMSYLNKILAPAFDYSIDFSGIKNDDENGIKRRAFSLTFKCENYDKAKQIVSTLESCEYLTVADGMIIKTYDQDNSTSQLPIGYGEVEVTVTGTFYERS